MNVAKYYLPPCNNRLIEFAAARRLLSTATPNSERMQNHYHGNKSESLFARKYGVGAFGRFGKRRAHIMRQGNYIGNEAMENGATATREERREFCSSAHPAYKSKRHGEALSAETDYKDDFIDKTGTHIVDEKKSRSRGRKNFETFVDRRESATIDLTSHQDDDCLEEEELSAETDYKDDFIDKTGTHVVDAKKSRKIVNFETFVDRRECDSVAPSSAQQHQNQVKEKSENEIDDSDDSDGEELSAETDYKDDFIDKTGTHIVDAKKSRKNARKNFETFVDRRDAKVDLKHYTNHKESEKLKNEIEDKEENVDEKKSDASGEDRKSSTYSYGIKHKGNQDVPTNSSETPTGTSSQTRNYSTNSNNANLRKSLFNRSFLLSVEK